MKNTKKIMFVLGALLFSLFAGLAFNYTTDNAVAGVAMFIASFAPAIISLVNPRLKIFKAAFGVINAGQITWAGDEVKDLAETIFVDVFSNPDLNMTNLIVEDIVAETQIVFMGVLTKITKRNAGCGSTAGNASITMSEKFWNPVPTEFWVAECATNLEQSFFVWGLKAGIDRFDLTNTDFAKFIVQRMSEALIEDIMRIAWFNDTDAAHWLDSPSGTITAGIDLTDYNIIDGLWKQIFAAGVADSTKIVAIARNAQSTYANQRFDSSDVTAKTVTNIFQAMYDNADYRLSETEHDGLMIMCTKSMYNQYKKELKSYINVEAAWIMVQNGQKVLAFDGIPVVPVSFWDRTIVADFNNGTKTYLPHRALLTVKENIPIGVDSKAALSKVENWYFQQDKTNNWRGGYKVDTKLLQDYLFMAAY